MIFGPLLVNYIIILFKIYMNEFVEPLDESNGVIVKEADTTK